MKLGELAKQEQDEYNKIIERQLKELDVQKRKDEEKVRLRYDHNNELR